MKKKDKWNDSNVKWKKSIEKYISTDEQEFHLIHSKADSSRLVIECSYGKYLGMLKQNPLCKVISGYKNVKGQILSVTAELPKKGLTLRKKFVKRPDMLRAK